MLAFALGHGAMNPAPFANALLMGLGMPACPKPTRCPYCPADAPPHWTHSGSYQRYAGDPDEPSKRVAVARYECKLTGRTFSLPPDALLPYCGLSTGWVLQCLHALLVRGVALNTVARRAGLGRGALRSLRARFLRTIPRLRLPGHEGVLDAAHFLGALARSGALALAELLRGWKEREPKLSVVGIYAR